MKHAIRPWVLIFLCLTVAGCLFACSSEPNQPEKPDDTTATGTTPESDPAADTNKDSETETVAETEPLTEAETPSWIPPAESAISEPANVAVNCPVITNGAEDGSNQRLTDGTADAWRTGYFAEADKRTFPYEAVIDLTRSYARIGGIKIHPASTAPNAVYDRFRVEISEDGITYTEAATHANATTAEDGVVDVSFANAVSARFVRIISLDLGARDRYGLEIAEVEVLAEITSYDNLLPNKRALAMQPGATDVLSATYRIPGTAQGTISYFSSNNRIVRVDEKTGEVEALCDGEAFLYVTDGQNTTPIPVTVQTRNPEYRVATFYLANHGENTREVFALLKESGITYIENCRTLDMYGNDTNEYLRILARDFGLTVSLAARGYDKFRNMTDEEIRAVAAKYKNLPGYGGLYIVDEPLDPNSYARVYRALVAEDPFCQPHLNLFPPFGQIADYHGYVTDWIATVGGDNLKSLSYDNYPYGPAVNTFHEWVYDSMDELRRSALLYDGLNTGYYIHSMGIHNAYRVPTDSEILYHTSLGVAYGFKDFKHFVWFTPPYSGSGEHFITGILSPEMGKSEIYEGVKAANTMLHTLSPILANTDAVEVYHYKGRNGDPIPENFCINTTSAAQIVLSLLVDRTTGQQYLVVVNKQLNRKFKVNLCVQDAALTELYNVTTGEALPIALTNGAFSLSMEAGSLVVIKLPEGYDARTVKDNNDGTAESLLQGIGASVSSSAANGKFAYMLNDGNRTGTGWSTNDSIDKAEIVFDLKTAKSFNRVDIYPLTDSRSLFPTALSVQVSDDGVTYRTVATAKDIDVKRWGAITFETVTARYVRISIDAMVTFGKPTAVIGEIELYMDNGQIPAMPAFEAGAGDDLPEIPYVNPTQAGLVRDAYDAVSVDGDMKINGDAARWLNEQGNALSGSANISFYGWAGFSQAIDSFGYFIEGNKPVWNKAFATYTEDGVKSAGGEHASRFQITADLKGLSAGDHTLTFLVKLKDGTLVLLHKPLTVTVP